MTRLRTISLGVSFFLIITTVACQKGVTPDVNGISSPTSTSSPIGTTTTPDPDVSSWLNPLDRNAVKEAYNRLRGTTAINTISWTGNFDNCEPGTVAKDFLQAQADHLNFIRALAGIGKPIKLVDSLNVKMQQAALVSQSVYRLTPPYILDTIKCLSKYQSAYFSGSIYSRCGFNTKTDPYGSIIDFCVAGYSLRSILLKPQSSEMGYGTTIGSNVTHSRLLTRATNTTAKTRTPFIIWPTPGYLPKSAFTTEWTFFYPKADFQNASISTSYNGNLIESKVLHIFKKDDGFSEGVAWAISTGKGFGIKDEDAFKVTIKNVMVDNKPQDFTYEVKMLDTTK